MPHRLLTLFSLVLAIAIAVPAFAQDAGDATNPDFDFPREWFYNGDDDAMWTKMSAVVGKSAEVLKFSVRDWSGENPEHGALTPDSLRGRVVVLEFWNTNNELSLKAIPYLNNLYKAFPTEGVEVIGIADERGSEKINDIITNKNIRYVTCRDTFRATAKEYGLMWHPWTIVIDRNGIVRAAGVQPEHVKDVVERIIEIQPASVDVEPKTRRLSTTEGEAGEDSDGELAVGLTQIPDDWIEAGFSRFQNLKQIVGKRAPTLEVVDWRNSHNLRLSERRGEVIMLFFFVVDDEACTKLARVVNDYYNQHRDSLIVIGIADNVAPDRLTEYIRENNLEFRIAVDPFRTTMKKYMVDTYPDFYFIDKRGILRAADVKAPWVTETCEILMEESH